MDKVLKKCFSIILLLVLLFTNTINDSLITFAQESIEESTLIGRITDINTKGGINGASVELFSGEFSKTVKTDLFGYYKFEVDEGEYNILASHPNYNSETINNYNVTGVSSWDAELTPLNDVSTTIDIYVEVRCVSSGIPLESVPVKVTITGEEDVVILEGVTDEYGVLEFSKLPKGFYKFSINEGENKVQGWDSFNSSEVLNHSLETSYWVDCMLKPEYRSFVASVFGYDPVKDEPNQPLGNIIVEATGMDPKDDEFEVMPAQVGVTGIRKEAEEGSYINWDNEFAEKVKFEKLIPVSYFIETKRMGYVPSSTWVRTNADGQFDREDVRFDIELEPTKLLVELDSFYDDPELFDNLEVNLRGFENTNTAGILRTVNAEFVEAENRAYALFENILPGDYGIDVNGLAERTVPVLVEGQELYENSPRGGEQRKFSAWITGNEVFYAANGVTTEVVLDLETEETNFKGTLYAVDDELFYIDSYNYEYLHYSVANKTIQIYASEYYDGYYSPGEFICQLVTNELGEFTTDLYPGLYGVKVLDMEGYWGHSVEFDDGRYTGWPYYQQWQYSYDSAKSYISRGMYYGDDPTADIGGMAISSSSGLTASFFVRKKLVNVEFAYDLIKNTHRSLVTDIDRTDDTPVVRRLVDGYLDIKNDGKVTLTGPKTSTIDLSNSKHYFTDLTPGDYNVTFSHPRFKLQNNVSLSFYDFPSPGEMPATQFPSDYNQNNNPWPRLPFEPLNSEGRLHFLEYSFEEAHVLDEILPEGIDVYKWKKVSDDPVSYEYVKQSSVYPRFFKVDYTGDLVFAFPYSDNHQQAHPENSFAPNVQYDYYLYWPEGGSLFTPEGGQEDKDEHWYCFTSRQDGRIEQAPIYILGPTPTAECEELEISYTAKVEARDTDNRDGPPINNVNISYKEGLSNYSSGSTYYNQIGDFSFNNLNTATHSQWNFLRRIENYEANIDHTENDLLVNITVYMEKGYALRGEVRNSVTNELIDGVKIKLLKAQGNEPILMGESGGSLGQGKFEYQYGALEEAIYFVEFDAPGYERMRIRIDPDEAVSDPNSSEHHLFAHLFYDDNAVKLKPLQNPIIHQETLEMNRFGAFIPGIKKAGNQSTFNLLNQTEVENRLTMEWSIQTELASSNYVVNLIKYDDANGPVAGYDSLALEDEIQGVYLVDRKSFQDKTFRHEPNEVNVPESTNASEIHQFLADIRAGDVEGLENVYYQYIDKEGITESEVEGVKKITGKTNLWKLPPDDFRPTFIVVTKLGAVEVFNFDYETDTISNLPDPFTTDPTLVGMRVPEWFGTFSDIMSYGAQATSMFGDAAKDKLTKVVPLGSYMPLPSFTADITLRADRNFNYTYAIDIEMLKGSATPSKGMLSVAPGTMGFSVFGGMEVTLKGADREFYIQSEAGLGMGNISLEKLTPKILRFLGVVPELDPAPQGRFYHIDDYFFDKNNYPTEKAVVMGGSGEVGIKVSASALQAVGVIPKVGWVLLAIKQSGALDFGFQTTASIGVRGLYGYKTIFPSRVEHDTSIVGEETRQLKRTFVGGNEKDNVIAASEKAQNLSQEEKDDMGIEETKTKSLDISVSFGVGLYASTLAGHVGADAMIEVAGDDGWTRKPALFIVINPNGDAPIINQIKGDVRASSNVYAKAWIIKLQKKYIWAKIPIDYSYKTETAFAMIPLEVEVSDKDREDYDVSIFNNTPEKVIEDFLEIGKYATDFNGGDLFSYTDMETKGGDMRLMSSEAGHNTSWKDPKEITKTQGAIVSHDIVSTSDGGYLAVWSEISASDVYKTAPNSSIKYSTLDSSEDNWSEAKEILTKNSVAINLELVPNGENIALGYLSTDEGPFAEKYFLDGMTYDSSSDVWSESISLVQKSEVKGFSLAGTINTTSSALTLGYVNGENELNISYWNKDRVLKNQKLSEDASNKIDMTLNHQGVPFIAWSSLDGGINLAKYEGSSYSFIKQVFSEANPDDLSILPVGERLALVWAEDDNEMLNYGLINSEGGLVRNSKTIYNSTGKLFNTGIVNNGLESYAFCLNEVDNVNLQAYLLDTSDSNTAYYQETHYKEGLDGSYTLGDTETKSGIIDSVVTAEIKNYEGFSGPDEAPTGVVNEDNSTIIRVDYARNEYTITYESNGGSAVDTITEKYGANIDEPTEPVKEAESFKGWYEDGALTEEYIFSTMPAENKTLYAKWGAETYQVTYNGNGYTTGDVPKDFSEYQVDDQANVLDLGNLEKEGHSFVEWNTQNNGNGDSYQPEDKLSIVDDVTLYAIWEVNQYTISFDSNGGSAVEPITENYGVIIDDPDEPIKDEVEFKGWYEDEAFAEEYIFNTMPAENKTLYAKWGPITYQVTYNGNGHTAGNVPEDSNEYQVDDQANVLDSKSLMKEGYSFVGWNTQIDGNGDSYQPEDILTIVDDVTLYAIWEVSQYTISFDSNGGSAVESITEDYNALLTRPNNPTRNNYEFIEWNPAFPERMPAENMQLVASWRREKQDDDQNVQNEQHGQKEEITEETIDQSTNEAETEEEAKEVLEDSKAFLESTSETLSDDPDEAKEQVESMSRVIEYASNTLGLIEDPDKVEEQASNLLEKVSSAMAAANNVGAETSSLERAAETLVTKAVENAGSSKKQAIIEDGKAKADLSNVDMSDQVNRANTAATNLKSELEEKGITPTKIKIETMVTLNVDSAEGVDEVEVALPNLKQTFEQVDKVKVSTGVATFELGKESIETEEDDEFEEKISLTAKKNTPEEIEELKATLAPGQTIPEDAQVINLSANVSKFSKTTGEVISSRSVTTFKQRIKVSVPYTLKEGDDPNEVSVFLVKADGTVEKVGGVYNSRTKQVEFLRDTFSNYFAMSSRVSFNDTTELDEIYRDAVEILAGKGLIAGRTLDLYDPNGLVTRAEFTALIARMLKLEADSIELPFTDVDNENAWYRNHLAGAYYAGIINGRSATMFDPNNNINRQEAAAIIINAARFLGFRDADGSLIAERYEDYATISSWAVKSVATVHRDRLARDMYVGTYRPLDKVTRAEIAVLIYNMLFRYN